MDGLTGIEESVKGLPGKPPLHLWHPELSGDIDIVIKANGDWFHEGGEIKRKPLVKLFASILRKESDGDYYLVTPVEKWRISVEECAFTIVDMDVRSVGHKDQSIDVTTNLDERFTLGKSYPLEVKKNAKTGQPEPVVFLDNHLTAKLTRSVFYRLADYIVDEAGMSVLSEGVYFDVAAE